MSTTRVRATILNVDDNEACRYAVTRVLQLHEFRVAEAANGAEALAKAAELRPDLVLLDINLPDINGFEVCRRLKADPLTSAIPVLHISASFMSTSDMARGLEGGAENYLVEPVDPDVLVATINAVLRARQAEDAARKLAEEWQSTMDAISDGLATLDRDGRIRRCNAAFAALAKSTPATLAGMHCSLLEPEINIESAFMKALNGLRREEVETRAGAKALRITVDPVSGSGNEIAGAVCIVTDITERLQLEEQFREGQKFETIGTLAAGVAHDFNNLLTSIMGNASLALTDELTPSLRERLQEIVQASDRAADLTRQLLAYSGKGRHFLQRVDLSEVVRGMTQLIEAAIPKKVRLKTELATGLPAIEADISQIQQVVMNLVSNSAEAIGEEAGQIRIATRRDGDIVSLEVQDTGCGMNAEVRSRIFDPFFSTKFTGRGLGLAAVAGIARGHKARIQVTSTPGEGSRFRIDFPAIVPKPAPKEQRPAAAMRQNSVLVVDDEVLVRQIAQATLEVRGFHVLVASDGREAIEQVEAHPEISLVVLDLTMPVMDGEEALDALLTTRPGLKILLSTGYDSREAATRLRRPGVAGYLQKPYTSRQLADSVRDALRVETSEASGQSG